MLVGWCPPGDAGPVEVRDMLARYPGTGIMRLFRAPGTGLPSWSSGVLAEVPRSTLVVVSIRDWPADVAGWLSARPTAWVTPVMLVLHHEPEQGPGRGDPTPARFRADWADLILQVANHPRRGELRLTPCFTEHAATLGQHAETWHADFGRVAEWPGIDTVAIDVYNIGYSEYRQPADMWGPTLGYVRRVNQARAANGLPGLPLVIAEWGIERKTAGDGLQVADLIRRQAHHLAGVPDVHVVGVCWFHRGGDDLSTRAEEQQTFAELIERTNMAGDYSNIPFLQAAGYARGRPDGPPLWIVVHTMEEDELPDTAERVARYFAYNTGNQSVSSHYCVDADSVVQCVRLGDVAWTVGNRPGNNRGINYELAGRAAQTSAQWADTYSQAMLRRFATVARRDMARYNIPARWCTVDDLRAFRPGLTTHNDLRLAFGGTTHTDPGSAFPRSLMLDLIKEDDMALTDEDVARVAGRTIDGLLARSVEMPGGRRRRIETVWVWGMEHPARARAELSEVRGDLATAGTERAGLLAAIQALAVGGTSVDTAAVIGAVDALRDDLGARIAALQQQLAAARVEADDLRGRLAEALGSDES